ncbi:MULTISPECIES: ribonuclease domain-containing protein [unclassified Actinopolyspora]|uniref:ribonuclease domain-containing protein n=1 Tax=unclassified Actinopolyspora TaxID=2639451 RepID=UPI0013F68D38|nr:MULTISPECIES: ribonuclease domain-containing protein [unclassified Actinopolyspora]NHD17274.1 ribonuclease [Actinopolyspora sp. BKK2]NHE76426.1 ribonuclease [Actinopolyspora sp. BKK1]
MRKHTANAPRVLLAGLFAVLGLLVPATVASAEPAPAHSAGSSAAVSAACGNTSGFEQVALSDLPPEATDTVRLIQQGGPYPYPEDGGVFHNWEGILPDCPEGYYHEYTVDTPGVDHRGARRFVVGSEGEYFYTDDHYESFRLTDINS